ncbi:inhibin alpha chain [Brachionichthys hirsutus]|uniref:inhibin alpha chain n=1 Tax=Brachionichthys hirsutus TaxID=412623 RepID=UPI003605342A
MVSCGLFIVGPLWIHMVVHGCRGEELSREAVVSWLAERVLEGLGLEEVPRTAVQGPSGAKVQPHARQPPRGGPWTSKTGTVNLQPNPNQEMSQVILFPSSEPACSGSHPAPGEHPTGYTAYSFQPSVNKRDTLVTSAHFWFYAGDGAAANSSAQLSILTLAQRLLRVAETPTTTSSDGWTTYRLDDSLLAPVAEGPFTIQVHCPACRCRADEPDKTPFLHLNARPRVARRSPRQAPVTIPWSPSAVNLLQRPSWERPRHSDCQRVEIQISFEELGWDNWIIHPKILTFYYCHGNCSAWDRTTAMLGITQCCAPVPGSMKSLRIATTSDGGYSFKYETLPNIIPEACSCI